MQRTYSSALWLLLLSQPLAAEQLAQTESEVVVITATRFEERNPTDTTVQVIDADEIAASGQRFLPDLLQTQAGISVRDNTGTPDKQVDIRGFGVTGDQNSVVLIDGQRVSENELASASWSSIPLDAIERVEIVRGGASVLYGAGAVGGVINIITRRPRPGSAEGQVFAGLGNYSTSDLRVSGQVASDSVGLTLALSRLDTDNYRENNDLNETSANLGLDTLGTGARVSFRLSADRQDVRFPGDRNRAELLSDRRGTRTPNNFAKRDTTRAGMTSVVPMPLGEFRADVGYRERETTSFYTGTGETVTQAEVFSISPRVRLPFHAGHALTLGVDWDRWDYHTVNVAAFPANLTAKSENWSTYAQVLANLSDSTTLSIGGRAQRMRSEVANLRTSSTAQQPLNLRAHEVTLKQTLTEGLSTYAKFGRAYRVATIDEVDRTSLNFLKPQTSSDRELGLRIRAGGVSSGLVGYHMNIDNEIHYLPLIFQNTNLPPTRRYGGEWDIKWQVTPAVLVLGNVTYARAYFRSGRVNGVDVTGKEVPLVPKFKANLNLQWGITEAISGNLAINWIGKQRFDSDEDNTFADRIPSYTTVDTRVSTKWGRWTFAGEVRNVLNEKYFTYAGEFDTDIYAYPAAERSFLVTGQVRF